MIKVKSKDVRHIIDATYPDYRKHNVYIKATDNVTFHSVNWAGGSKSEYRACTIDGKSLKSNVDMGLAHPMDNQYEGMKVALPIDHVIVEGGYFCGKKSTLYINVHPDNMPKLIS